MLFLFVRQWAESWNVEKSFCFSLNSAIRAIKNKIMAKHYHHSVPLVKCRIRNCDNKSPCTFTWPDSFFVSKFTSLVFIVFLLAHIILVQLQIILACWKRKRMHCSGIICVYSRSLVSKRLNQSLQLFNIIFYSSIKEEKKREKVFTFLIVSLKNPRRMPSRNAAISRQTSAIPPVGPSRSLPTTRSTRISDAVAWSLSDRPVDCRSIAN